MIMAEDLKARVRDFWQSNPCGAKFAEAEIGTREFFARLEHHRYQTEWHILDVVGFEKWQNKDVLEIGCGLGTDGASFARAGARYTAIDLTDRAVELARRRFEFENLEGNINVGDAENLPFDDASFDLVYSHGVLHHTPDTQRAINEAHRVLRPGGTAIVMLYHKNSYNYYVNIMTLRKMGVRLLRFDWGPAFVHSLTGEDEERLRELQRVYRQNGKRLLSRDEFLNQNTDGAGNPLARAYTRREALKMFSRFGRSRAEIHFLNKRWIPVIGGLIPRPLERKLSHLAGWHLWIIAQK